MRDLSSISHSFIQPPFGVTLWYPKVFPFWPYIAGKLILYQNYYQVLNKQIKNDLNITPTQQSPKQPAPSPQAPPSWAQYPHVPAQSYAIFYDSPQFRFSAFPNPPPTSPSSSWSPPAGNHWASSRIPCSRKRAGLCSRVRCAGLFGLGRSRGAFRRLASPGGRCDCGRGGSWMLTGVFAC